jgi:molybdenum cofactor cytidylyltransferase
MATQPTAPAPRISCAVLAAGASTRMGEPKALLPFGRVKLLDLALSATALPEFHRAALVLGAHAAQIEAAMWLDEVEVLHNAAWERGMITSVQAAVGALATDSDWVLLFPCDYALVARATVAHLAMRALSHGNRQDAPPVIAPSMMGRSGHPIVLGRETFDPILNLNPELGLDTVVHAFRDRRELVEVDDPAIHFDIDTPEDYRAAAAAYEARRAADAAYLDGLKR